MPTVELTGIKDLDNIIYDYRNQLIYTEHQKKKERELKKKTSDRISEWRKSRCKAKYHTYDCPNCI